MFGQSFFLKQIVREVVEEVCLALEVDEEDAREFAEGAAFIGGIGAAIATADFIGGCGVVAEELAEDIITEEVMGEALAENIVAETSVQFGGNSVVDGWSTANGDIVFDRIIDDQTGADQYGNLISEITDQSPSIENLEVYW